MTICIKTFYKTHQVEPNFDEEFYAYKHPETQGFYEPYCSCNGIDNRHRLFYHWFFYNRDFDYLNVRDHYIAKFGIDFSQIHTGDIEQYWKVNDAFAHRYYENITFGKIKAATSSLAIVGLARDIEKHIDNSLADISKLIQYFKKSTICVYENDSSDNTRKKLESSLLNINVIGGNHNRSYLKDFSIQRTQFLAEYRNECLNWIKNNAPDYDYVLVVDLDADGGFSIDGILNSLFWLSKIDSAGCMGSYSAKIIDTLQSKEAYHYDTFAFKFNSWDDENRESVWTSRLSLKVGSDPILVKSCFGGLALYKTQAFLSGVYNGEDCEHISFHKELYKNNWQCYLNPSSRFVSIIEKNKSLNFNKLQIIDTYQDNTGLGLLNKDLKQFLSKHKESNDFLGRFKNRSTILIPGRPDEYKFVNEIYDKHSTRIIYWTTFESTQLPKDWIDNLNKSSEILVPHKSICDNFIKSGVHKQISILEQPYQRYNRTKNLSSIKPTTINIGFNGLPTNRKNLTKLLKAIQHLNKDNKKFHLHIKLPRIVNSTYQEYLTDDTTLDIGDYSFDQMSAWYSKLDAYIFPSSGEGWSFTPREALYLGIPTVITDIGVHEELLPYVCRITNNKNTELAYYEFCQAFHGYQNQYSAENIIDALNDLFNNYNKYLTLAQNGSKWIESLWTQEKVYQTLFSILEPTNFIVCPSQHKLCGLNHYTESLTKSLKDFKYISNLEDIYSYDLNNIKNIHIQHEWSLYDNDKMLSIIKSLPKHINKQITLHSVIRNNPSYQQKIIDTFDEVYSLCSRSISIDPRIKYTKHGADLPLYCGDKNLVKLNKESRTIGTFGFLHPNKGYEYVAKALEDLNFNYKIVATHKGSEESIILENNLKNKPNVILDTNVYDMYMIYKIMLDCKALIFYYHEDNLFFTSGAVLEAGRFGLPIITSDECMFDDLGDAVCRVEKKNTDSLISAIAKLSDTNYCQTLVNNMNKLLSERDWKVCSKQYYHN